MTDAYRTDVAAEGIITLEGDTLPPDVKVVRYEAREYISRPFLLEIEFCSSDANFDVEGCMRKPLLLTVIDAKGETRRWNGLVDSAEFMQVEGEASFRFQVRLVPALSSLTHREDCRIFQDKSIIDIAKLLFQEAGFGDQVEWNLLWDYEPRNYCVQWRESQLNFVQRLFEDEGVFFFFRHTPEGHKMVVGDGPEAFVASDDATEVIFAMAQGLGLGGTPLDGFSRRRSIRTSDVKLRDYDFEKPQTKPVAAQGAAEATSIRYYEYPGNFKNTGAGNRRTMARLSMLRRDADLHAGRSKAIGLRCGVPFIVEGASEEYLNGEYVVTDLFTRGLQSSGGDNYICKNEFGSIPKGAPFAPPRLASRPRIYGIQTAMVMGPSSVEQGIHTDKYGRIKVRFHWDRVGQKDDKATCWMRVSQLLLGGSMIIPRQNWEVAVSFLDGDPDRPIVLGRLYNGTDPPPYALPANASFNAMKSMSTPGGAGHNEFQFGDSGGGQGFNIKAQKDLNISAGHDKKEGVGVDSKHSVGVNKKAEIGSNETVSIGVNQTVDVGDVFSNKVTGSQSITVGAMETDNATANFVEKITGDRSYTVGGMMMTCQNGIVSNVTGNITRTVGAVQLSMSIGSISDTVASLTQTVGAVRIIAAKGDVTESSAGRNQTAAGAEIHLIKGNYELSSSGMITTLVGGLHYQKIAGDYSITAPMITLIGAVGTFKGGDSVLKLGGGPVVLTGSKIAIKGALVIKMSTSLKMGD